MLKVETAPCEAAEDRAKVAEIRQDLAGQQTRGRWDLAEAQFGLIMDIGTLRDRIRKTIPFRLFNVRHVDWEDIGSYTGHIPDQALLKYEEARRTGLFRCFKVAAPMYSTFNPVSDPWLLGYVDPSHAIVLAYWE